MSIDQYRHREKRKAPVELLGMYHSWWKDGSPPDAYNYGYKDQEFSEVFDENHGRSFFKNPYPDNGGNFDLYRTTVTHQAGRHDFYRPVGGSPEKGLAYSGLMLASEPVTPIIGDSIDAAKVNAAKLWNNARPAQPLFEGLNAFYELREVPDMLKQRFIEGIGLHTVGDIAIGYQFGWQPLLSDIRDFYLAHLNFKKALDQILRDEGRQVRRSATITTRHDSTIDDPVASYGAFYPSLVTQCYAEVPTFRDTWKYEQKVWLKGAFRYYLPGDRTDWRWKAWMADRIFGLNPTPSRVYKAIPWSWLVDWFSNVGDILEQVSSKVEERLLADYAYVMCSTKATRKRTSTGVFYPGNSYDIRVPVTSSVEISVEHKARIPAGVFGPGVVDGSLSPTQLGILGALGLSRSNKIAYTA